MKFHRDQYLEIMTFGKPDRPMFVELFGPLIGLEEEWLAQGASQDEIDMVAFDWDFVPVIDCGGNMGIQGGLEPQILEEDDEYRIERDALGRTVKLPKKAATISLPLDFPVKDMDSWLKVKPLFVYQDNRIDWEAVERARMAREQGALVVANLPGAYDFPRELMGDEKACTCYYEDLELMLDILNTLGDTAVRVLEQITRVVTIDQLSVHEDLAGKSGPLVGPRQVREFFKPYYRKVWEILSSRGARLFDMDSDGNITPILDALLDCGLNATLPLEPAAGMDIVELRKKYQNRLSFRGGIDKFVLLKDQKAIREELEYKMQPAMQEGGTVFGLDHRIINGTPLENYRYYVDTGREILGLPPRSPGQKGWRRMAF